MSTSPHPASSLEQNRKIALRWFEEVWNQGQRQTIFELFPKHGVLHDGSTVFHGPDEFCRFYDTLRAEFSQFRVTPIVTLAEGDLVCLHWSASLRHTATSKPIHITGTSIVRVQDGVFAEAWQNWDSAGLVAQLTGAPSTPFL